MYFQIVDPSKVPSVSSELIRCCSVYAKSLSTLMDALLTLYRRDGMVDGGNYNHIRPFYLRDTVCILQGCLLEVSWLWHWRIRGLQDVLRRQLVPGPEEEV